MFITNKRCLPPTEIEIGDVRLKIVDKFKLLGIVIDRKLNFNDFVASIISSVKKKQFAIKRIYYLSFNVKIQFFKTFILPYFGFGLSLIFYFSKTAIGRLTSCYYNSLNYIFKLTMGNSIIETNNSFKEYGLFSFHHRFVFKLAIFSFNIKSHHNSPSILKSFLEDKELNLDSYNLRSNERMVLNTEDFSSELVHGMTFKKFFCSLL